MQRLDREIVIKVSKELNNITEQFVEKDWYVTKVIEIISKIKLDGYLFIFTGGTSLLKAHKLIQRFSEDIDFKLIILDKNLGKRKDLSILRKLVVNALKQVPFFDINDEKDIIAMNQNRYIQINIDYKSNYSNTINLRPHIQCEITAKPFRTEPKICSVGSIINEVINLPPEVSMMTCINPAECAADKLSALSWRIANDNLTNKKSTSRDRSLMRHLYDLYHLKEIIYSDLNFHNLVNASIEEDIEKYCEEIKNMSSADKFANFIKILETSPTYRNDYATFVKGLEFSGNELTFDNCIKELKKIVKYFEYQ